MSITWNGVSSDTIGVIVERIPNRYVPTRRFSPQQVAGRNGNILLVDKSFPNVEQEYEVYLSAEAQGLPSVARACAEWLMGPDGYCRLQDSYDTTVYREAFLMGGYDLENILNKFGRCTITFSCKPQKYLLTGDTPISIPAGTVTTYTGSSVQFDGITGASITSLSTTITPTQDLHGYDSPWPGGGGINKADYPAIIAAGATEQSDGSLYVPSATAYSNLVIFQNDGTAGQFTITFKSKNPGTSRGVYPVVKYTDNTTQGMNVTGHTEYATATLTTNSAKTVDNVFFRYGSNVAAWFYVQVESGATAHDWTPYSNICPISGLTGLSVYVGPTQDPDDATVYNVGWSTQAGTVYGGTLNVVTGELVVDRGCVNVSSSWHWNKSGSYPGGFYVDIGNAGTGQKKNTPFMCSHAKTATTASRYVQGTCFCDGSINIRIMGGSDTVQNWKDYIDAQSAAGTPIQICYKLDTPITYQLTPQEIQALVGTNYVWLSDGDVSLTVATPLGGIVTNPTPFEARPLLTVSGVGEITINGKSIQILESVSDFEIDCETMEAEDNSKIYCMDFPELSGGENKIVGYGSITALTVTPRWWTL